MKRKKKTNNDLQNTTEKNNELNNMNSTNNLGLSTRRSRGLSTRRSRGLSNRRSRGLSTRRSRGLSTRAFSGIKYSAFFILILFTQLYARVLILIACGKYLHGRIFSLRWGVCAHKAFY